MARRKEPLGVVDYTLAKRALIRKARKGMVSTFELCDAHPELMRAAIHVGEPASRPCPVCEDRRLVLLAYVFADTLASNSGRVWGLDEALIMTARTPGAACYVVEVCTGCSWNHISETFTASFAV